MCGAAGLDDAVTFEQWYEAFQDNLSKETVRAGLVSATTFLAVSENTDKLVGMIDIRHELNEHLLNFGGHIGYSIRKSERNKGYATEMLALGLIECKTIGINKVLITCDKKNTASAKTMLNNGAVFENEVLNSDGITQRYWITID